MWSVLPYNLQGVSRHFLAVATMSCTVVDISTYINFAIHSLSMQNAVCVINWPQGIMKISLATPLYYHAVHC